MEVAVTVRCPCCGRRLFDIASPRPAKGVLCIKCPTCKALDVLDLSSYNRAIPQSRSVSASNKANEPTS